MHLKLISAGKPPGQIEVPQLHGEDPWRRGKVVHGEDRRGSALRGELDHHVFRRVAVLLFKSGDEDVATLVIDNPCDCA